MEKVETKAAGMQDVPDREETETVAADIQNVPEGEGTEETTAAGMQDAPEGEETEESWMEITTADFEEIIQKAAKAAVLECKKQEKEDRRRNKYHNTFTLMKCYRDAVFHIQNAVSDGRQLELKEMTEDQRRVYLESIRRSRFKTLIMTEHIDKAVEEIERRRREAGREEEYRAFDLYFIQGKSYEEIAQELKTGNSTPRRWITGIINEMSVLLWGIDEDKLK